MRKDAVGRCAFSPRLAPADAGAMYQSVHNLAWEEDARSGTFVARAGVLCYMRRLRLGRYVR